MSQISHPQLIAFMPEILLAYRRMRPKNFCAVVLNDFVLMYYSRIFKFRTIVMQIK